MIFFASKFLYLLWIKGKHNQAEKAKERKRVLSLRKEGKESKAGMLEKGKGAIEGSHNL